MTVFLMICKHCHAEYEAGPDDIAKGIRWWAICPACRAQGAAELPRAEHDTSESEDAA